MFQRALRFAYRRAGPHYPRAALVFLLGLAYAVGLAGVALLRLYQDMSGADLVKLCTAVVALVLIENFLAARYVFRLIEPASAWLNGRRTPETAVEAWTALSGLPRNFLASGRFAVLLNVVPISLYVTWELELVWYAFFIIAAGAAVCLSYGVLLRFFGMELLMRPVLEDVSRDLPPEAELGGVHVPLRWKLLLTLPAVNVITGVVASGLSAASDSQSLADLGWDVLIAVSVAFTISFGVTLLLARSMLDQVDELRDAVDRVQRGDRAVHVPLLTTDETGVLASSFNTMIAGMEERERLREAFGLFVDPEVIDRVLAAGTTDLEGEEVEVSVLFLDIRGFTEIAERMAARELVAQLNEFYGCVVPVLERHAGHANKFVGDGLLGVFGAPQRLPDHADRALLAALDIAATVDDVFGGSLTIGVGINSGTVLAGTVGGGGHVEFTVIGDAVNTAARVEEVTRLTGDVVLITEATRCLLTLPFGGFDERPTVALKGKSEKVRLWAPRPVESGRWRPRPTQQAPSSTAAGSSPSA